MSDRFVQRLRRIAIGGLAGAVAGLVIGGIGGRLFMRIAAILSPEAAGRITEAGEIVGVVSLNGTIALLFFGGLFGGLVASVLWIAVSDWLPRSGRRRLLAAAIVAVGLLGHLLVRSDNVDFRILDGDAIVIALILAVVALTGAGLAWLEGVFDRRMPRPAGPRSRSAIGYGVIALLGLVAVFPIAIGAFTSTLGCGCSEPQSLTGGAIAVAGTASLVGWLREIATGSTAPPAALLWTGRAGLAGAIVLGTARLVEETALILGS